MAMVGGGQVHELLHRLMKVLSLDPSKNNVGWATFDGTRKVKPRAWKWGTFQLEGMNLEMRMYDLVQKIGEEIGEFDFLVTERPAFFSCERGEIAAHQNYTIDLAAIAYYVAGWYHMDHRHHFAITANQWKGTVSKAVTARRFFRSFPYVDPQTLSEHAIDAVMLARFTLHDYICNMPSGKLGGVKPSHILSLL